MPAVTLEGQFSLDNLLLREAVRPTPAASEVLIEMRAASINYRDLMLVRGEYNPRQKLPLIIGSDGVGVVAELGPQVTEFALGERVSPMMVQGWHTGKPSAKTIKRTLGGPLPGVLQSFVVANVADVARVPGYLTDVEAATLPCAALTAWSTLFTHAQLQPGERVLILGTGGVALFALQLARAAGAHAALVSGTPAKFARLRELGVDLLLDRRAQPEWGPIVKEWAQGEGVDVVVEVGGAGTLQQSLLAVRPGGMIAVIGVLAGAIAEVDLRRLLMRDVALQGVFVGHRQGFEQLCQKLAETRLRPVVDQVFPLSQIANALRYLEAGEHFGKVCISFD